MQLCIHSYISTFYMPWTHTCKHIFEDILMYSDVYNIYYKFRVTNIYLNTYICFNRQPEYICMKRTSSGLGIYIIYKYICHYKQDLKKSEYIYITLIPKDINSLNRHQTDCGWPRNKIIGNNSWTPCPKQASGPRKWNKHDEWEKKKFGEQGEDWAFWDWKLKFQELEWLLFSLKLVYIPVIKQPNPDDSRTQSNVSINQVDLWTAQVWTAQQHHYNVDVTINMYPSPPWSRIGWIFGYRIASKGWGQDGKQKTLRKKHQKSDSTK